MDVGIASTSPSTSGKERAYQNKVIVEGVVS